MANKEFVAVNWTAHQILDEDSMDQINSNLVWMRNRKLEGKYQHLNNATTEIGLKLLCGRKQITPRKSDTALVQVGFTKLFTPGSTPVITTSITSPAQINFYTIINGIGRLQPNHQGFECKVNVAGKKGKDRINKSIFINWIAMGY
jgi:hypothetical protein